MKRQYFNRLIFAALTIAGAAFNTSCSTANNNQAWAKIQSEGLIPYLVDGQAESRQIQSEPQGQIASRSTVSVREKPEAPVGFERSHRVTAQVVAGKPGFVYSPHTSDPKMIDVRDFQAGSRARCPYTKKSFIVPAAAPAVLTPQPRRSAPTQAVARRKPAPTRSTPQRRTSPKPRSTPVMAKKTPDPPRQIPTESIQLDPQPISGIPKQSGSIPSETEALALPKKSEPSVPVGKRVAGKPNYVHSPFAANNQVVDVEGHPAGTKVRCPYSDKVFAVPPAAKEAAE